MSVTQFQLEKEKEYLNKTLSVIKEIIFENGESIQDKINEINEVKRYIWENRVFFDEIENDKEMDDVNDGVNFTNEKIKKLQKLQKSLINPYFGRIDFEKDGQVDSIYIGINSVMKDFDFYVFDWRTPIASMFYNYEIGPASYEAPQGTICGNINLKRQYKIKGNNIERCFNCNINIDDDYLQEILANSSSDKMSNIVITIQREQNEIIRNIKDKYLIVQGVAGSGKTSVALHRIAYLLYKEKELTSNNILIFSPNEIFSEYISDVLPDLGEENALQTTFSEFASAYIKDFKEIESFTSFIERYYKCENIDENEFKIIKYKLSNEFKIVLDNCIEKIKSNIYFVKGIKIKNKEMTKQDLNRLFLDKFVKLPFFYRIDAISEYLCDTNKISIKKYGKLVKEKLCLLLNDSLDIKEKYYNILNEVFGETNSLKTNKKINYEDLLPLMYLHFELNGYPLGNTIKHVIIDEAQDYSLLQLEILKKIFYKSSFTILGDINQTINPYYSYNNLSEINDLFNQEGKYIELLKTYRSSEEIIKYTNKILGINNVCAVRKNNNIPIIEKDVSRNCFIKQLSDDIKQMKTKGIKRIAVITKNNADAIKLYEKLEEQISDIGLVQHSKKSMTDTVILPSYMAKGLEFDGVIVCDSKKYLYQEKGKYLFYVVCTRAQHNLIIYNLV